MCQAEIRKSIIKHDEATAYPLGMELKMKHAVDHRSGAVLRENHAQNTDKQPISLSLRHVPPHRNNPQALDEWVSDSQGSQTLIQI